MTSSDHIDELISNIIHTLIKTVQDLVVKNQQKTEDDLSDEEKHGLMYDMYKQNKLAFLTRFGKHLSGPQLRTFQFCIADCKDDTLPEIRTILRDLQETQNKFKVIRNRRFEAMKKLIAEGSYFSDIEMKSRNPDSYEEYIGQYLTPNERQLLGRDQTNNSSSLVNVIMESLEQSNFNTSSTSNVADESNLSLDDDSSSSTGSESNAQLWGEFTESATKTCSRKSRIREKITEDEKQWYRDEFTATMHERFLSGQDEDFDYALVDANEDMDDYDMIETDAQEKYFDDSSD